MFDPISLGLGYGAWKLGKYIFEEFNKPSTPPDLRKEAEINALTAEPIYFVVAILAKFAKSDDIVTKNEIATVEEILREIELTGEDRTKAVSVFRKYKDGALSYEESLAIFAELTENAMDFRGTLCVLLLRLAHADGIPPKRAVEGVRKACDACGIDYAELFRFFQEQQARRREAIAAEYELLGCSPSDSADSIKARYRYLTKTFHPDTIAGKDLPPEFTKVAEAKFRDIQDAYERITSYQVTFCEHIVERRMVECPHCGNDVEFEGDGEYTCPECDEGFTVANGEVVEPIVECPHCNENIIIDGDGEYTCPWCKEDVTVVDGEPLQPCEVECPHCSENIIIDGDGEYTCCWCKEDVTVIDGEPIEPYEIECPHCGEEVVVEGDGEYTCPECDEDFVVG